MSLARVIGSLALATLLAFWPVPTGRTAAAQADGPPDPRSVPAQHGKADPQHSLTEFPTRRPVVLPLPLPLPVSVPAPVSVAVPAADPCAASGR